MVKKAPEPEPIFPEIAHPKKRAFLAALIETGGNTVRACEAAGISRRSIYTPQWKDDESFQAALVVAKSAGADVLEAEAVRRAYEGVEEPTGWYRGEPGGTVTRYSDTLTIFLLKGAKPEKYAERHEHSGPGGAPLQVSIIGK